MALEIFKVPLGILALTFPSVAVVATNHRSKQFVEIMRRNKTQSCFANYFTHREEFFKVLSRLEKELDIKFNDGNGFYRDLFLANNVENLVLRSREINSKKSLLEFNIDTFNTLMESIRDINLDDRDVKISILSFLFALKNQVLV